jgi:hypothetical protein
MPIFFEINDSLLESLDQNGESVSVRLRAVRKEFETGARHPSNHLRQEIRLVLDGAELSIDSSSLPTWLIEGSFRSESSDAAPDDCGKQGTLPASLRSARGVELVLSGLHEGSGDFVTIRVRANSLSLETLGAPQPLQYTRASI